MRPDLGNEHCESGEQWSPPLFEYHHDHHTAPGPQRESLSLGSLSPKEVDMLSDQWNIMDIDQTHTLIFYVCTTLFDYKCLF